MDRPSDHPTLGSHLFRFAAISDTHVNPSDDICNSPFPVNRRANRRFRHLVAELNQRDLDFVLHLGDLVHPVPSSGKAYEEAARAYHAIARDLAIPIHLIPGNHDIGDKPGAGGPVPATSKADIGRWKQQFGNDHSRFEYGDLQFVLLNAQLINSGVPDEEAQKTWAEKLLKHGQRTILALHHPPFICNRNESDHYDNLQQPGRDWAFGLMELEGVELALAGHAHNFWYDRVGAADYYRLPAISFVRQDYAEMLHAPPGPETEFGRDDAAKLGYMIFDFYENGHTAQIVRTNGAEMEVGTSRLPVSQLCPPPAAMVEADIGFDLRQNWAEIVEIAPSGALDEFDRKPARNDYHLMALIEMGVTDVRVPLTDLRDETRRERLKALRAIGIRPTLFALGVPDEKSLALISELIGTLSALELTLEDENSLTHYKDFNTDLPIYFSPLKMNIPGGSGIHRHVIEHGFSFDEKGLEQQLNSLNSHGFDGVVLRCFCGDMRKEKLSEFLELASSYRLNASVHLRAGGPDPSVRVSNTSDVLAALDIASQLKQTHGNVRFFLDTLVEQDRGYFPRPGALDSTLNPTEVGIYVQRLHGLKQDFRS